MTNQHTPGDRVLICLPADSKWHNVQWLPTAREYDGRYGDSGGRLFGVVERVFKNGLVAVAVPQVPNKSHDNATSLHFPKSYLIPETEHCPSAE